MRVRIALIAFACVVALTVVSILLPHPEPRNSTPAAPVAPARPRGPAVVVRATGDEAVTLRVLKEWAVDPTVATETLRGQSYLVAQDPTGLCVSARPPVELPTDPEAIRELPARALVWVVVHHSSSAQWAGREKGYLSWSQLSDIQRAAAQELGRRHGLLDAQGNPRHPNTRLVLYMGGSWQPCACQRTGDRDACVWLGGGLRPPTAPAIAKPPLKGSVLWWSWPHADASWGARQVSIEAETYALAGLLDTLSAASGTEFDASVDLLEEPLVVAARDTPARELAWAIAIAVGANVEVRDGNGEAAVVFVTPSLPSHTRDTGLSPLPDLGYYTPLDAPIAEELRTLEGDTDGDGWLGWRFADLPLMYRNMAEGGRPETGRSPDEGASDGPGPQTTVVLWVKTVHVSLELRMPGGGSFGPQPTYVPAL